MSIKRSIIGLLIALGSASAARASVDTFAGTFIHVNFCGASVFVYSDSNLTCPVSGTTFCRVFISSLNRTTPGCTSVTCSTVVNNSGIISTPYSGCVLDAD